MEPRKRRRKACVFYNRKRNRNLDAAVIKWILPAIPPEKFIPLTDHDRANWPARVPPPYSLDLRTVIRFHEFDIDAEKSLKARVIEAKWCDMPVVFRHYRESYITSVTYFLLDVKLRR